MYKNQTLSPDYFSTKHITFSFFWSYSCSLPAVSCCRCSAGKLSIIASRLLSTCAGKPRECKLSCFPTFWRGRGLVLKRCPIPCLNGHRFGSKSSRMKICNCTCSLKISWHLGEQDFTHSHKNYTHSYKAGAQQRHSFINCWYYVIL